MTDYSRVMALDVGNKKIGVAMTDPLRITTNPWGFVDASDRYKAAAEIGRLIERYDVKVVVAGMPRNMDGTEGAQALRVRKFLQILRQRLGVEAVEVDERLSTWEAEEMLIEAGVSRLRRKQVNDQLAAAIILRRYLDGEEERCSKNTES